MSESTRGIEVMGQAVAVALLLALTLGPAAAKEPATTAAVVVEAPAQGDAALARQIENLLTTTLDGQGIRRVRFGREDVSARETEIRKQIDDAFARVTAGMRSKPFDEGNEILNAAFFQAKQILGRIDPGLMARLYKAFAAAQVTLGRKDLGEDYVIASLNLDPEQSPRSFHYFSDMRWVVEAAHKRFKGKRHAVTLAAKPSSARIIVDGKDLGPGPGQRSAPRPDPGRRVPPPGLAQGDRRRGPVVLRSAAPPCLGALHLPPPQGRIPAAAGPRGAQGGAGRRGRVQPALSHGHPGHPRAARGRTPRPPRIGGVRR
jgi:hypothetical protein